MLLSLVFLATVAAAIPSPPAYDYGFKAAKVVKRQTQDPIIVTKLPSINGTIPNRPDIRELKDNPFKWNLFLLASSMFQFTNQSEQLSWYQIAGKSEWPLSRRLAF